ncbi:MAG: hypothetical protein NTY19_00985 [Planctomycetota bacterium]|nr:hypothetical protein [Planctomycetota bacterium]
MLSDEIPPAFGRKLNSTCTQIAKLTEQRPPAHEGQERDWACWFRAEESAGYREWQSLMSLANSALPEGCPWHEWFRLGTAIAVFQQELFLQSPYGGPCELPLLQPVLDCAVKIFEQGYRTVPEIERLARHALSKPWQPQPQILAGVVETPDCDLDCDLEPSETHRVLTWQMIRLNDQIRVSLRKTLLTPMVASENVAKSGPTVLQQLVPTVLQKAILAALDGRGLTKQALANEVCGSEGTRLYKPGGIKELAAARLVANKGGVGYYRPDAPPAGTVILDQHQTGTN